jgi:hypothetical protein
MSVQRRDTSTALQLGYWQLLMSASRPFSVIGRTVATTARPRSRFSLITQVAALKMHTCCPMSSPAKGLHLRYETLHNKTYGWRLHIHMRLLRILRYDPQPRWFARKPPYPSGYDSESACGFIARRKVDPNNVSADRSMRAELGHSTGST